MKHLTFILLFCLGFAATASAQLEEDNKSEYRYWGIVFGINHGFGAPENTNENVMLHTAKGDMYKKRAGAFNYTPGFQLGGVYNFDFKNNKSGIQAGLEFASYGCRTKYETRDNDLYDMTESFRAMAVTVPLLFKFGPNDIYRDMTYITAVVEGEVVEQFRAEKVWAFKMKRRKSYRRTIGHRQNLTKVKITAIKEA